MRNALDNVFATRLTRPGDTHGFHYDYTPLGLIICLEGSPRQEDEEPGGQVVIMPPEGEQGPPEAFYLNPGDGYLMRTTERRHAVAPLKEGQSPRGILSFSFEIAGFDEARRGVSRAGSTVGVFLPDGPVPA